MSLHIDGGANGGNVGGILVSGSSATTIAASGTNGTGAITVGHVRPAGRTAHPRQLHRAAPNQRLITDNGSAADPVSLVTMGSGSVILSGTNTYTGGTTVSGGTLTVA